MATHSSVLAWRIPGTGEPGGLPSMGPHRVRHDWSDLAAAAALYRFIIVCLPIQWRMFGLSSFGQSVMNKMASNIDVQVLLWACIFTFCEIKSRSRTLDQIFRLCWVFFFKLQSFFPNHCSMLPSHQTVRVPSAVHPCLHLVLSDSPFKL